MKREDFIWTIGYQDETAIVDGPSRRSYGKLKARELLELGLYRAAFCAALYDQEAEQFLPEFQAATGITVESVQVLKRLYGVFSTPDTVQRCTVIG